MNSTSVGETLAARRAELGLNRFAVARATRLNRELVRAIEHGELHRFSAAFYARGCVGILARFYGLDACQLTRRFMRELPASPPWRRNGTRTATPRNETDAWCYWFACLRLEGIVPWALAVALMVGLLGAFTLGHRLGSKETQPAGPKLVQAGDGLLGFDGPP